jgi:hypothetical protein
MGRGVIGCFPLKIEENKSFESGYSASPSNVDRCLIFQVNLVRQSLISTQGVAVFFNITIYLKSHFAFRIIRGFSPKTHEIRLDPHRGPWV